MSKQIKSIAIKEANKLAANELKPLRQYAKRAVKAERQDSETQIQTVREALESAKIAIDDWTNLGNKTMISYMEK